MIVLSGALESVAVAVVSLSNYRWLADSGCSRHMAFNPNIFDSIVDVDNPIRVKVASGHVVMCNQMGVVHLPCKSSSGNVTIITLHDVLLVPGLRCNLFSVGLAARQGTVNCSFEGSKGFLSVNGIEVCSLVYSGTNKLPHLSLDDNYGVNRDAVLALATDTFQPRVSITPPATAESHQHPNSLERAHCLLGHVNYRSTLSIARLPWINLQIKKNHIARACPCEACAFTKTSKRALPSLGYRLPSSSSVGDIVHSDSVPVTVISSKGFHGYHLFFDFSMDIAT